MIVKELDKYSAYKFIEDNNFDLMINGIEYYKGVDNFYKFGNDKYSYYGVFDNDKLVAIQKIFLNFNGWSYEKDRIKNSCHLISLQKIPNTPHGVFKTVLDYFSNSYKGKNIYLEVYVDKLKDMYESLGFKKVFKGNCHFYKKYING